MLSQRRRRLKFLSPTNAPLYYTYKMLKYTVKISPDCSYMFRSIWTIIREPMPNPAKVTLLWRNSVKIRREMFSNVGKKCFKLWCVLCAVHYTAHNTQLHVSAFRWPSSGCSLWSRINTICNTALILLQSEQRDDGHLKTEKCSCQ